MRIAVYTSIFGNYDDLPAVKFVEDNIDYYVICDASIKIVEPWRRIHPSFLCKSASLNARHAKLHPELYFGNYDISIWIDANCLIRAPIYDFMVENLVGHNFFCYSHPERRTSLSVEADLCVKLGKVSAGLIKRQVDDYIAQGVPDHWDDFCATGIMARKHREMGVKIANRMWWAHIARYTERDQVSLCYVRYFNKDVKMKISGDYQLDNNHFLFRKFHRSQAKSYIWAAD